MQNYVFIPNSLDVDKLILEYPPEIPHFSKEKLLVIISTILEQKAKNVWKVYDDHIQIMSREFRLVADDYVNYIHYLFNNSIISWDKTYQPSSTYPGDPKSMGYKFLNPYFSDRLKRFDLNKLPKNERGSNKLKSITSEIKRISEATANYNKLKIDFPFIKYLDELKLDLEKADECIENISKKLDSRELRDDIRLQAQIRLEGCIISLSKFQYVPSRRVLIDSYGYRLHSPLTQLKKEFRYFLTYKGEQLVSLDLKNSQPFLSLAIMNPEFWSTKNPIIFDKSFEFSKKILKKQRITEIERHSLKTLSQKLTVGELYPEFDNVLYWGGKWVGDKVKAAGSSEPDSSVTSVLSVSDAARRVEREGATAITIMWGLSPKVLQNQSFTLFRKLVVKGEIYEKMVEWLDTVMDNPDNINALKKGDILWDTYDKKIKRNAAKALFVRAMFGPSYSLKPEIKLANKMLRNTFPFIHELYSFVKKGNYKVMARLLQRIESFLILKACTMAIRKTNKPIPIWTIHDSIITIDRYKDLVQNIMTDTIKSYIGEKPSIEVEYWANYKPGDVTFLDKDFDEFLGIDNNADDIQQ